MTYLICTSKDWDKDLVKRLKGKLDFDFEQFHLSSELTVESLEKIKPKKIFFPHWSHIIKPEIFEHYECVIFHMTDLPYGRGGSPLQNLIVRGHKETKISALRCKAGVDTGPIYMKRPLGLEGTAQGGVIVFPLKV